MPIPKFKILSIDGGGIRGIIPCVILKFLEEQTGSPISQLFNLITGTSTGGIIGIGLTKPDNNRENAFSAKDMLDLYVKNGHKIFAKRKRDLLSFLSSINKTTNKLFSYTYDSKNIDELLKEYFGETRIASSLTDLLVTTYEIEKGKPFYFSSRLAKDCERENYLLCEIARSTAAAPTYFTPSIVNHGDNSNLAFIDGGVFSNNPSILGYAEAKELWKRRVGKGFNPVILADDKDLPFFLLSVGTGFSQNEIRLSEAIKWRTKHWIEPLLSNIFMRSVAESTHYTMQHLLPPYTDGTLRYQRLDFKIPEENIEMDDTSSENIEKLIASTTEYIRTHNDALLRLCDLIS